MYVLMAKIANAIKNGKSNKSNKNSQYKDKEKYYIYHPPTTTLKK